MLRAQLEGRHHVVASFQDSGLPDSGWRVYETACGLTSRYDFGDSGDNHLIDGPLPPSDVCKRCQPPEQSTLSARLRQALGW